jgi:hypothetical protein
MFFRAAAVLLLTTFAASGQSAGTLAKGFFQREKAIWTSPFRMDGKKAATLALGAAAISAVVLADVKISRQLPRNGDFQDWGVKASRLGGAYGLIGITGGILATGALRGDSKLRNTGVDAAEAFAHAALVTYGLKFLAARERPNFGSGRGHFFSGHDQAARGDNSFPSGHSMGVWAVATVISKRYGNHKIVPWLAYSFAGMVSVARVAAQRHFVSDVVVGAAAGYGIGSLVTARR